MTIIFYKKKHEYNNSHSPIRCGELSRIQSAHRQKIAKTENQLNSLEQQLADAAEAKDNESDWMDDSSNSADIEMLEVMGN